MPTDLEKNIYLKNILQLHNMFLLNTKLKIITLLKKHV